MQCFRKEAELKNERLFQVLSDGARSLVLLFHVPKKKRRKNLDPPVWLPWRYYCEMQFNFALVGVIRGLSSSRQQHIAGAAGDTYLSYPVVTLWSTNSRYGGINLARHRVAHFINGSGNRVRKCGAINKKGESVRKCDNTVSVHEPRIASF